MLAGSMCQAQYSQILFKGDKILVVSDLNYCDRILYLKKVNNSHSQLAEIFEFDLTPIESDFTKRSSFQFSKDSSDYLSVENYANRFNSNHNFNSKLDTLTNGLAPRKSTFVLFQEEEQILGHIPDWVWDNPKALNINLSTRENLLAYRLSEQTKDPSNGRAENYNYNTIYNFGQCGYFDLDQCNGDYNTNKLAIKVLDNLFSNYCEDENEIHLCKFRRNLSPYYWKDFFGLPNAGFKGESIYFGIAHSSYGKLMRDIQADSLLMSDIFYSELDHRELSSKSDNRNFLSFRCNSRLIYKIDSSCTANNSFRLVFFQLNERDSLQKVNSYQLPENSFYRSSNGSYWPVLSDNLRSKNPKYSLAIDMFLYHEVFKTASVDKDGTLNFFGYQGKLKMNENELDIFSTWDAREASSKEGLFQLRTNGEFKFIPTKKLLDRNYYRDDRFPMIETQNQSHFIIADFKKDSTYQKVLLVQERKSNKFITYCVLPDGFEPISMSEINENKIALVGTQKLIKNNFYIENNSNITSSVLIFDIDNFKNRKAKVNFKVEQIDFHSGHVYCSSRSENISFIFPLQLESNESGLISGSLLLNSTDVSFVKKDNLLQIETNVYHSEANDLGGVLTQVINIYFTGN